MYLHWTFKKILSKICNCRNKNTLAKFLFAFLEPINLVGKQKTFSLLNYIKRQTILLKNSQHGSDPTFPLGPYIIHGVSQKSWNIFLSHLYRSQHVWTRWTRWKGLSPSQCIKSVLSNDCFRKADLFYLFVETTLRRTMENNIGRSN